VIARPETRDEAIEAIHREIRRQKVRIKQIAENQREEVKHEISRHEQRAKQIDALG